jgi:hypothetical protein
MHPIASLMTLPYQYAVNCLLHRVNKKGHPALAGCPQGSSHLLHLKKRLFHFSKIASRFFACHAKSIG